MALTKADSVVVLIQHDRSYIATRDRVRSLRRKSAIRITDLAYQDWNEGPMKVSWRRVTASAFSSIVVVFKDGLPHLNF